MKLGSFSCHFLALLTVCSHVPSAGAADDVSVDLTGPYSAVVTVRRSDGTFAEGTRYKLTYTTPETRDVILDEGTPRERMFRFEPTRLIATIAAGTVPADGRIQLQRLAGVPRTFSLVVGDDGSRPGDFFEGSSVLRIAFTNRVATTNFYLVEVAKPVGLGEPAPEFLIEDVFSQKTFSLSDVKGKLVVLKFWATDCPPCQPDMTELNQLIARKGTSWKDAVTFVSVGMDGDADRLRRFVQKHEWNAFRHAWTGPSGGGFNSPVAQSYGIRAVPACYIIHPTGLVVWRGNRGNIEWLVDHFLNEVKSKQEVDLWIEKVRSQSSAN